MIYEGDCLDWLPTIPEGSVDMCYIDPPFFSQRDYGDYCDKWDGIDTYIGYIRDRVILIHRCLKDAGSIFLHCDHHANHRLRVMLDKVFGEVNFRNEIVWCYTGPGCTKQHFPRKHDTILFYGKSKESFFKKDSVRVPYKMSTLARAKYPGGKNSITERYARARTAEEVATEFGRGKVVEDWWSDIPSGGQISRHERASHATQKPEKLLERIVNCCTSENSVVLDCFVGSGTTAAVCKALGRRYIVGDINPDAIRITRERVKGSHDKA